MKIRVDDVSKAELPEDTTHGFKVLIDDEVLIFSHWHEDGEVEESEIHPARQVTSYAEVLKQLPKRLKEMGYEKEVDAIVSEVTDRYGKGN